MSDGLIARTVDVGDRTPSYLATSTDSMLRAGVVVIHHMIGWDRGSKEITRRFAELGYDALCPNLHHRDGPGASSDDAAAANRAAGGVPDAQLLGDIADAVDYLRARPTNNGKVGVIGYCSGGRQSVLAACNLNVDAAVDCYGAFVTGTPTADFPIPITNIVDQLLNLRCPLLGLFGNEDHFPSPAHVDELEQLLIRHGKNFELHRYDGAGHAFFATDRPWYQVDAANDGWERVEDFFRRYL